MLLVSPNFSDLFAPNIEIKKFPDGESYVRIPGSQNYAGQTVTVFHRLYPDQNQRLFELLLILDELSYHGCKVTVVSPYLPYSRQDKKVLEGEIPGGKVVCSLLAQAGCKKFITLDCHFLKEEGEFSHAELPIKNISMNAALIDHARDVFGDEPFEIIAPDQGAKYMVKNEGGSAMTKVREGYTGGAIIYREVETLEGTQDVDGKNVLILDDMIATGSTMIKAIEQLREAGAKKIACAATHGLFLGTSLDKLQSVADAVFVTDSIPGPAAKVSIKSKFDENVRQLF
jgi:ribose-phosphate pyrophosphokinase